MSKYMTNQTLKTFIWPVIYLFALGFCARSAWAEDSCVSLDLLSPVQGQVFQMDMNGPSMPVITLQASCDAEDLEFRFQVGDLVSNRALEYEDAPSYYNHPSIIDSGWRTSSSWNIDFGKDIYGGHVTDITVSVRRGGCILATQTFKRDFYIVGNELSSDMRLQYISNRINYDEKIRNIAKAISLMESRGHHFWTQGIYGSARIDYYPLREKNRTGGYGLMQLTSERFLSRETIWNWKANIDMALSYIQQCYDTGAKHLLRHPENVTERMFLLEAYNRYNGGLSDRYHWWNDGSGSGIARGWVKFSYISTGEANKGYRDYNNDGKIDPSGNPWNIPPASIWGKEISGLNIIAKRASMYADNVLRMAYLVK